MAYAKQFLHNFEIPFFFICDFIDIDECKGNHSCHENANCTNTNGSHLCDCQPGYTGNGQNCTGEFGIARKCGHGWFILVRSFFFCIYNVFCAPLAKQKQFKAYALDNTVKAYATAIFA